MRGETDFLDWVANDDDQLIAKSEALKELQHCVPILAELPIATILRIRNEEKNVFEAYRDAVTKMSANILNSNGKVSRRQAREMLRDVIEPELLKMKRDTKAYRTIRRNQLVGSAVPMAAGVLLGAYGGLPAMVGVPMVVGAAAVSTTLLGKAAVGACSHGPEFKQKNDLYFLLRLTNESRRK